MKEREKESQKGGKNVVVWKLDQMLFHRRHQTRFSYLLLFFSSSSYYCEYPTFFSRIASALAFIAALRASRDLESSPVRPTPPTAAEAGAEGRATAAATAAAPARRREERALLREVLGAAATEAFPGAGAEEEEARTWSERGRGKEVGVESFFLQSPTCLSRNDGKARRSAERNCPSLPIDRTWRDVRRVERAVCIVSWCALKLWARSGDDPGEEKRV